MYLSKNEDVLVLEESDIDFLGEIEGFELQYEPIKRTFKNHQTKCRWCGFSFEGVKCNGCGSPS